MKKALISTLLCISLLASLGAAAFGEEKSGVRVIDENELQEIAENYFAEKGITADGEDSWVGIGFYYSKTGESWFYNGDLWAYSASLYKVGNCMLLEDDLNEKGLSPESKIEGYSIAYQMQAALCWSDNDRGHDIVRYLGGGEYTDKCIDKIRSAYTSLSSEYCTDPDYSSDSRYTARFMTEILIYLLEHEADYPNVLGWMKQTQPGDYFRLKLRDEYEIAQKYGNYQGKPEGAYNYHNAGIIYTPSPIVLTVMGRSSIYSTETFGELAEIFAAYSLLLDERYEEAAAKLPEETPSAAETPAVTQTPAPAETPTVPPAETAAPTASPEKQEEKRGSSLPAIGGLGAAVILAVEAAVKYRKKGGSKYTPKH